MTSDAALTDQQKIGRVREMFDAWHRKDWRGAVDLFTPDGVFHNIMLEPTVGRDAIHARICTLRVAEPGSTLDMNVKHIGVIDGLVFVERFDSWIFGDLQGGIPVVGVFEFRGDRIACWREIYDRASLRKAAGYDSHRA